MYSRKKQKKIGKRIQSPKYFFYSENRGNVLCYKIKTFSANTKEEPSYTLIVLVS